MDYTKIYSSLINMAKKRIAPNGYFESHHVIPRSLGGSDEKNNLVNLTVREHFVAHQLLFKIHRHEHPRLIYAVFAFFEDANAERKCLRERGCWMHGWLRRAKTIITAKIVRDLGHEKTIVFNRMPEERRRAFFRLPSRWYG